MNLVFIPRRPRAIITVDFKTNLSLDVINNVIEEIGNVVSPEAKLSDVSFTEQPVKRRKTKRPPPNAIINEVLEKKPVERKQRAEKRGSNE